MTELERQQKLSVLKEQISLNRNKVKELNDEYEKLISIDKLPKLKEKYVGKYFKRLLDIESKCFEYFLVKDIIDTNFCVIDNFYCYKDGNRLEHYIILNKKDFVDDIDLEEEITEEEYYKQLNILKQKINEL